MLHSFWATTKHTVTFDKDVEMYYLLSSRKTIMHEAPYHNLYLIWIVDCPNRFPVFHWVSRSELPTSFVALREAKKDSVRSRL
jgi:hypothetical protein